MNKLEIGMHVRKIIQNCLQINSVEIEDDENLVEKFSINSIDAIGIFLMIEDVFKIQIEDDDLGVELIESIESIIKYIMNKQNGDADEIINSNI